MAAYPIQTVVLSSLCRVLPEADPTRALQPLPQPSQRNTIRSRGGNCLPGVKEKGV